LIAHIRGAIAGFIGIHKEISSHLEPGGKTMRDLNRLMYSFVIRRYSIGTLPEAHSCKIAMKLKHGGTAWHGLRTIDLYLIVILSRKGV
jgi:hypothetical protein